MRRLQGIKNTWKLSLLLISLISCSHPKDKVYQAELFTEKTALNTAAKSTVQLFKRLTLTSKKEELIGGIFGRKGHMSWNIINYRDTTIHFNPNLKNLVEDYQSDETPLYNFYTIYYLNPQKTAFLADMPGPSHISSRVFVFCAQPNGLNVYRIERPVQEQISSGDENIYMGISKIGGNLLLVNNDYIFNQRIGKAYLIPRPDPKERMQADFTTLSPDGKTAVFNAKGSSTDRFDYIYQFHYPSGKFETDSIPSDQYQSPLPDKKEKWPETHYDWHRDANGRMFLKPKAAFN
ncbi:hypothetical protein HDF26_000620 [Pedobacter cryoconitis]|uniref:hypothetical protein n=1 Tax=Pedobacter cryoconitis TaxID=188932 RepID=UPI00160CD123|nr:hypothetical protein [Pedobacter cryoconitis]MBB6270193.1 hypothetical protein [Pedobacter cryoconitis]